MNTSINIINNNNNNNNTSINNNNNNTSINNSNFTIHAHLSSISTLLHSIQHIIAINNHLDPQNHAPPSIHPALHYLELLRTRTDQHPANNNNNSSTTTITPPLHSTSNNLTSKIPTPAPTPSSHPPTAHHPSQLTYLLNLLKAFIVLLDQLLENSPPPIPSSSSPPHRDLDSIDDLLSTSIKILTNLKSIEQQLIQELQSISSHPIDHRFHSQFNLLITQSCWATLFERALRPDQQLRFHPSTQLELTNLLTQHLIHPSDHQALEPETDPLLLERLFTSYRLEQTSTVLRSPMLVRQILINWAKHQPKQFFNFLNQSINSSFHPTHPITPTHSDNLSSHPTIEPFKLTDSLDFFSLTLLIDFMTHSPYSIHNVRSTNLLSNLIILLINHPTPNQSSSPSSSIDHPNRNPTILLKLVIDSILLILPRVSSLVGFYLPFLFIAFSRSISWYHQFDHSPSSTRPEHLLGDSRDQDHFDRDNHHTTPTYRSQKIHTNYHSTLDPTSLDYSNSILNFFNFLYGLAPCNFIDFIRSPIESIQSFELGRHQNQANLDENDLDHHQSNLLLSSSNTPIVPGPDFNDSHRLDLEQFISAEIHDLIQVDLLQNSVIPLIDKHRLTKNLILMTSTTERREISNRLKFYEAADLIEKCEQNLIISELGICNTKNKRKKKKKKDQSASDLSDHEPEKGGGGGGFESTDQTLENLIDHFESEVTSIIHPNDGQDKDVDDQNQPEGIEAEQSNNETRVTSDLTRLSTRSNSSIIQSEFNSSVQPVYPDSEFTDQSASSTSNQVDDSLTNQDLRSDDRLGKIDDGLLEIPSHNNLTSSLLPSPTITVVEGQNIRIDTKTPHSRLNSKADSKKKNSSRNFNPKKDDNHFRLLQNLRLQNILLQNQLNLELYLKSQHLQQLGSIHKQNISVAGLEAENQNLIRMNKEIRKRLNKVEEKDERNKLIKEFHNNNSNQVLNNNNNNNNNQKNRLTYLEFIKSKNCQLKNSNFFLINSRLDLINRLENVESFLKLQNFNFVSIQTEAHNLNNELKLIKPKLLSIEDLEKKNESLSKALLTWDDDLRRFRESRNQILSLTSQYKKIESLSNSNQILIQTLQERLQTQIGLNNKLELENKFLKRRRGFSPSTRHFDDDDDGNRSAKLPNPTDEDRRKKDSNSINHFERDPDELRLMENDDEGRKEAEDLKLKQREFLGSQDRSDLIGDDDRSGKEPINSSSLTLHQPGEKIESDDQVLLDHRSISSGSNGVSNSYSRETIIDQLKLDYSSLNSKRSSSNEDERDINKDEEEEMIDRINEEDKEKIKSEEEEDRSNSKLKTETMINGIFQPNRPLRPSSSSFNHPIILHYQVKISKLMQNLKNLQDQNLNLKRQLFHSNNPHPSYNLHYSHSDSN